MVTRLRSKLKAYYCDTIEFPLPPGHRFPKEKYRLTRELVQSQIDIHPNNICLPPPAEDFQILRVHTQEYLSKITSGQLSLKEQKRLGFPWSKELVERSRYSVGGTIQASITALNDHLAVNLAGGTHHAFPGHGEGFCLLNDVAISAKNMFATFPEIERILIVDCDVHQGNGTAAIFAHDDHVFTFSIHSEKNYPFRKYPSDLDIALPDFTGDELYLMQLTRILDKIVDDFQPQFVFYLAGADPHKNDRLGRLALTKRGLAKRDRLVMDRFYQAGIPTALVLSGGYGRHIHDTAEIHAETVKIASGILLNDDNQ